MATVRLEADGTDVSGVPNAAAGSILGDHGLISLPRLITTEPGVGYRLAV